jgi:hypothetical protein
MQHGRRSLLVHVIERSFFVHPPHLRFRIWHFRLLMGHMEVRYLHLRHGRRGLVARVIERDEDEYLFRV